MKFSDTFISVGLTVKRQKKKSNKPSDRIYKCRLLYVKSRVFIQTLDDEELGFNGVSTHDGHLHQQSMLFLSKDLFAHLNL